MSGGRERWCFIDDAEHVFADVNVLPGVKIGFLKACVKCGFVFLSDDVRERLWEKAHKQGRV